MVFQKTSTRQVLWKFNSSRNPYWIKLCERSSRSRAPLFLIFALIAICVGSGIEAMRKSTAIYASERFFKSIRSGNLSVVAAPSDQQAQLAHARGSCGSLGPGTGLVGSSKGWIVSMVPGKHQFRVRGGTGNVYLTAARKTTIDFDAGRLYYLVIEGAGPAPVIEWKIPGSDWGIVSKYFLYPPSE